MEWKVCGVHELPDHLSWATHVLSISSPGYRHEVPLFPGPPLTVLSIDMDDVELVPHGIAENIEGKFCPPDPELVRKIIGFGLSIPDEGTLLVHCQMGISRSTAALLSILAARNPSLSPSDLLKQIAVTRPIIMPNRLIIRLADQYLQRKGALVKSVAKHWEIMAQKGRY